MRYEVSYIRDAVKHTGLAEGTVAFQSHVRGCNDAEPLMFGLAGMIRYAEAYMKQHECPIAEDGYAAGPFLATIKGYRSLLNCDGAVAMERGITTDSKDNGVCEHLFWKAVVAGGFTEADL